MELNTLEFVDTWNKAWYQRWFQNPEPNAGWKWSSCIWLWFLLMNYTAKPGESLPHNAVCAKKSLLVVKKCQDTGGGNVSWLTVKHRLPWAWVWVTNLWSWESAGGITVVSRHSSDPLPSASTTSCCLGHATELKASFSWAGRCWWSMVPLKHLKIFLCHGEFTNDRF